MRIISTWILGLGCCLTQICSAKILHHYHCLSGQIYQNHLLEATLHLEPYKDDFLSTMEWNNQHVAHGRLDQTNTANLYVEQWSSIGKSSKNHGISVWKFEENTVNIRYHGVNQSTGKFYQGEINCRAN